MSLENCGKFYLAQVEEKEAAELSPFVGYIHPADAVQLQLKSGDFVRVVHNESRRWVVLQLQTGNWCQSGAVSVHPSMCELNLLKHRFDGKEYVQVLLSKYANVGQCKQIAVTASESSGSMTGPILRDIVVAWFQQNGGVVKQGDQVVIRAFDVDILVMITDVPVEGGGVSAYNSSTTISVLYPVNHNHGGGALSTEVSSEKVSTCRGGLIDIGRFLHQEGVGNGRPCRYARDSANGCQTPSCSFNHVLCEYFMNGYCRNGDECSNVHSASYREMLGFGRDDSNSGLSGIRRIVGCTKTRGSNGNRGDRGSCNGSSMGGLGNGVGRGSAGAGKGRNEQGRRPSNGKTCFYYLQGICNKGNDCPDAHPNGRQGEQKENSMEIDELTYDQLLELEQKMGSVNIGLSDQEIKRLKQKTLGDNDVKELTKSGHEQCYVCFEEFIIGEKVTELLCEHTFHISCINRWLQEKPTCPVCRIRCH